MRFEVKFPAIHLHIILFVVFAFSLNRLQGQSALHITNYDKKEYRAANQNWSVSLGGISAVFTGNNHGLLCYDGAEWLLKPVPGKSIIRAVLYDSSRVYVGLLDEFGYFDIVNGKPTIYHCLSTTVSNNLKNQEYWRIAKHHGKIYFQSFGSLYVYDGREVSSVPLDFPILLLIKANDELFTQRIGGGLYRITENGLKLLEGSEIFADTEIKAALTHQNDILFCTNSMGIYRFNGFSFEPWHTAVDAELKTYNLNTAVETQHYYCIGTILKGVLVLDHNGQLVYQLDSKHLQNSTILSLEKDKMGNIWVGKDKGISYVAFNSPVSIHIDDTDKFSCYSGVLVGSYLYMGTNQGIFRYSFSSENMLTGKTLVSGSQGQVWFIKLIDGKLYCGLNDGTYLLENDKLEKIGFVSGGYNLEKFSKEKDLLIQSTYNNLVTYRNNNGRWEQNKILQGFSSPSRFLQVDFQQNIWVGHSIVGVNRLQTNSNVDSIISIENIGQEHGLNFQTNRIYKIENRIVIPTGSGFLRWNDLNERFEPFGELNAQLQGFEKAHAVASLPDDKYWLIKDDEWGLFEIRFGKANLLYRVIPDMFNMELVEENEKIIQLNDSLQLVCLDNGFAILNILQLNRLPEVNLPPNINDVRFWRNEKDSASIKPRMTRGMLISPAKFNNIRVTFASNEVIGTKRYFQYTLEGMDGEWSTWQTSTSVSYKRLPPGDYTFKVRTLNSKGILTPAAMVKFSIQPPFFLSWKAGILYICIILAISGISRNRYKKRIKQHFEQQQRQEQEKIQKEREENERVIMRIQNERLRADIENKNSQLAMNTMSLIRKNALLQEFAAELENMKNELGYRIPNKYYDRITRLINQNIENEHDWETFQKLFDQAHENFFKSLKDAYPSLTTSDLRLCAYIRMNLSSKEIAPLLNITVRGVEERRYRLRKRLNLSTDESLNDFILKL